MSNRSLSLDDGGGGWVAVDGGRGWGGGEVGIWDGDRDGDGDGVGEASIVNCLIVCSFTARVAGSQLSSIL